MKTCTISLCNKQYDVKAVIKIIEVIAEYTNKGYDMRIEVI